VIRWVIFDWGDTIMRDRPEFRGPMASWPQVEAMPGADAMLAALRGCYRLALATNAAESGAELVCAALARVGLDGAFEVIVTARELGASKPDPAFFAAVLAACDCAPGEAVMVGDSLARDVLPARAAGMRGVWYCPGADALAGAGGADAIVRDLRELPGVLDDLAARP